MSVSRALLFLNILLFSCPADNGRRHVSHFLSLPLPLFKANLFSFAIIFTLFYGVLSLLPSNSPPSSFGLNIAFCSSKKLQYREETNSFLLECQRRAIISRDIFASLVSCVTSFLHSSVSALLLSSFSSSMFSPFSSLPPCHDEHLIV